MDKIHVDFSTNEDTYFNTFKMLRLPSSDIPAKGDIITFSDCKANGIYEVVERRVHYEKGELFSVRIVVKDADE